MSDHDRISDHYIGRGEGNLHIGRVLGRSFSLLFGNFLGVIGTTLILWLLLLLLLVLGSIGLILPGGHSQSPDGVVLLVVGVILLLLSIVVAIASQAALLQGAFQELRGERFGIGASLPQGFRHVLPLFAMHLMSGFACLLGFWLLFVPACILATMWFVAQAACVVERLGPLASLKRSIDLTKGHRWKAFGIYALIAVAGYVATLVLFSTGTIGVIVALFLWVMLVVAYWPILVAVVYHDLRATKEGIGADRVAAVFE